MRRALPPDWIERMRFFRLLPAADGRDRDRIVAGPGCLCEARSQKSLLPSPQATSAASWRTNVPDAGAAAGHSIRSPRRSARSTLPAARRPTGSGKTEVYLNAISGYWSAGQQALVLVPEIRPEPAARVALQNAFRTAAWRCCTAAWRMWRGPPHGWRPRAATPGIVLGSASPCFADAEARIGVVDEEHDTSFNSRRDCGTRPRRCRGLSREADRCPVVLGTANPRRWRPGTLAQRRYDGSSFRTARLRVHACRPCASWISRASLPSRALRQDPDAIARGRRAREQSLIFINRRGYAPRPRLRGVRPGPPAASAARRAWWCTPQTAVYRCHHCGAESAIRAPCPTCGNVDLKPSDAARSVSRKRSRAFSGARIVRIDRDSARRRASSPACSKACIAASGDILVGTQLLPRGTISPSSRWWAS